MSGQLRIRREVRKRGISRLCHFTRGESLRSILGSPHGIISCDLLDRRDVGYRPVDSYRWDGYTGYVSCSVEYPNTRYMMQAAGRAPSGSGWAVLCIDPCLLEEDDTLFCHCNAATSRGEYAETGYTAFRRMYADRIVDSKREYERPRHMLECCPTNDQAEVLVRRCVPLRYITGVMAPDEDELEALYEEVEDLDSVRTVEWLVAPDLFTLNWIDLVATGEYPEEYYVQM